MTLIFRALPTDEVRKLQASGPDANGRMPERHKSDGNGNPCRHCLRFIPRDAEMLIVAYRPFSDLQPYAEVGPIFLCAEPCERHRETGALPELFENRERILVRGYTPDNRIKYGTGQVINTTQVEDVAARMFEDEAIAYIHMRSATNNCYQCRIDRG